MMTKQEFLSEIYSKLNEHLQNSQTVDEVHLIVLILSRINDDSSTTLFMEQLVTGLKELKDNKEVVKYDDNR